MEWYTISINPPEINEGQDLIFRRECVGGYVYDVVHLGQQFGYSDFEELNDSAVIEIEMTHWAVLTDYNEGNNNE